MFRFIQLTHSNWYGNIISIFATRTVKNKFANISTRLYKIETEDTTDFKSLCSNLWYNFKRRVKQQLTKSLKPFSKLAVF